MRPPPPQHRQLQTQRQPWALLPSPGAKRRLTAAAAAPPPAEGAGPRREGLKRALLAAVSRANAPPPGADLLRLQDEVEAAAGALAEANPTPDPAASPLISGPWALLYTGPSRTLAPRAFAQHPAGGSGGGGAAGALRAAVQSASDGAYRLLYRAFPLVAGSAVRRARGAAGARNLQTIDLAAGRVDNCVTSRGKGGAETRVTVSGRAYAVPAEATGGAAVRLGVVFESFSVELGRGPRLELPLAWLSPEGYVDTIYLDASTRVSLGDKFSLFVTQCPAPGAGAEAPSDRL